MNAQPPKQKIELSPKQKQCFEIIRDFQAAHGHPPKRKDIAEKMGISEQMVGKYLTKLQRRGWIVTIPGEWHSITIL